jgi:hypothetical protein
MFATMITISFLFIITISMTQNYVVLSFTATRQTRTSSSSSSSLSHITNTGRIQTATKTNNHYDRLVSTTEATTKLHAITNTNSNTNSNTFQLTIDLPPSNSDVQVQMTIESILSVPSELIVVRYKVPFGINIEPKKQFAYVTADGPGGERIGDILRYTSQYTMGLPRGDGIGTTFASFAGGLKWQCSMFNIMSVNKWEQVMQALLSNTIDRTDEVVFIFERPLNGVVPPELL